MDVANLSDGVDARKCPECGGAVAGHGKKRYCGEACASSAKRRFRRGQSRDLERERRLALARSPERICQHCGATFRKAQKDKEPPRYCSKTCSGKATIGTNGLEPAVAALRKSGGRVAFTVIRPLCAQCGARFTAPNVTSRLCSAECRRIDALAKERARASARHDKADCKCRECGVVFRTAYGDLRRQFCSEDCRRKTFKRVSRKRERARKRLAHVEPVDPIKVFIRDQWKCRLCGVKTPKKLRGTREPNAPELDHIKPLALGGEHSYRNTQCACRKCNGEKGAVWRGQMRLFG